LGRAGRLRGPANRIHATRTRAPGTWRASPRGTLVNVASAT